MSEIDKNLTEELKRIARTNDVNQAHKLFKLFENGDFGSFLRTVFYRNMNNKEFVDRLVEEVEKNPSPIAVLFLKTYDKAFNEEFSEYMFKDKDITDHENDVMWK